MERILLLLLSEIEARVESCVEAAVERALRKAPPAADDPKQEFGWMSNAHAMDALDVSRATLQRLRSSGALPFSKVGGNVYYRTEDIEELLERHVHVPSDRCGP